MKSILKKSAVLSILSVLLITLIIPVFAHPGSLDANGGHYDRSTGEYHYHHGYSAHQHTNGECPYDFHDNANTEYNPNANSSSSSSSSYTPTEPTTREQATKISDYNSSFHKTTVPLIIGIALGLPFSLFAAWSVFVFLSSCVRTVSKINESKREPVEKSEQKTTISQSIHQDTERTEQNIPLPVPQQSNVSLEPKNKETKQQDKTTTEPKSKAPTGCKYKTPTEQRYKLSAEQVYKTQRERIFQEIITFSLTNLIKELKDSIELTDELDLIFPNTKTKKYGKYTVYLEQKTFIIHRLKSCNNSPKYARNCLEYSIGAKYSLCSNCWKEKEEAASANLFMPEWYSEYKIFMKNLKKYNFSIDEFMQGKQKILSERLKNSEFKMWKPSIHTNIDQIKKIAKTEKCTILSYNPETKKAKIQGSNGNVYETSFHSCTCKSWEQQNHPLLPCKHMYKLAAEYGGIDFSKYI